MLIFRGVFVIYPRKKNLEWIITSAGKRQLIICATFAKFLAWLHWHRPLKHWDYRFGITIGCLDLLGKHRRHDQICTSKDRFGTSTFGELSDGTLKIMKLYSFLSILNVYLDHFTLTKLSVESGSVRVEVIFENICWFIHITWHISVHEQNHAGQWSSESQDCSPKHTVAGRNPKQPPGIVLKPVVNNGINDQPQLVTGFLNHQQEINFEDATCITPIYSIDKELITHFRTIDPDFQRDILVCFR